MTACPSDDNRSMISRRTMLLGSAGAAIGALAGCSEPRRDSGQRSEFECADRRHTIGCGAAERIGHTKPDTQTVEDRRAQAQGGGGRRR